MEVDWNLSVAAHGESLEHVPQCFLISRGVEEKWPHYWVIFPQSTLTFFTFEEYGALRVEGSTLQATDPHDYTSYYCTCHLFSLALGMFAMVTAHSRLSGLTHAVLCISQLGCDEGKSLPMIPNPWWGGFSISAPGPAWASYPSLLLCHPTPIQPQRESLPWISSYFLSQTIPDSLNCPFCPLKENNCWSSESEKD